MNLETCIKRRLELLQPSEKKPRNLIDLADEIKRQPDKEIDMEIRKKHMKIENGQIKPEEHI